METHQSFPFLRETLLFLALTGILVPLLQRLRINQVLGFLAAGALLGPFGLGLWAQQMPWLAYLTFPRHEGVVTLANLGVLFLMFMIGLELSAERLWSLRRWVFIGGSAQICLSTMVIGGIAWLFGNPLSTAAVLGFVLSMSSTAVVMQLMTEQHTLGTPLGQACFSILMMQDLIVVPLLILIGAMAQGSGDAAAVLIGLTLLKSVAAIGLIYVLGRRVIRPLFRLAGTRQAEVFMALTLLCTLGIAALTEVAGLSMALGAFLAGLLLAETEFKHEVEVTVDPFKGLLMGLFFMTVGMGIDTREVMQAPVLLPLSVLGLFLIKALILAAVFRAGGFHWGRAVEGGLLMGQGSEFTFIVVGYAIGAQLMPAPTGQFMMLVAGLSLFATPVVAKAGHLFAVRWERRHPVKEGVPRNVMPQPVPGQIIIAGFGRVGQLVAQLVSTQGARYVAFELNVRLAAKLHAQGLPVYFGDASRVELLRKVEADRAAAIVLTMDHPASALHAIKAIRREYPEVLLLARARDEKDAQALKQAGASFVVPETLESGLQLSEFVLHALGVDQSAATHLIQAERERRIVNLHGPTVLPNRQS